MLGLKSYHVKSPFLEMYPQNSKVCSCFDLCILSQSQKKIHSITIPIPGNLVTDIKIHCSVVCETVIICCSLVELSDSCLTLCDPMDCSMPGFPVHHRLPEPTQTHVHILIQYAQCKKNCLCPKFFCGFP